MGERGRGGGGDEGLLSLKNPQPRKCGTFLMIHISVFTSPFECLRRSGEANNVSLQYLPRVEKKEKRKADTMV